VKCKEGGGHAFERLGIVLLDLAERGSPFHADTHGHAHTVSVLDDGFEYRGERYPSLTRIARRITGVHWSGPLFFGISKRRRVMEGPADE
jgi:hypothetical protein